MSPDDPRGTSGLPAALRRRDIVRTVGSEISELLSDVDDHAEVECRLLAGYGQFTSRVVRIDGSYESVRTPRAVKDFLMELREKVMYSPGGGTWMSARSVVRQGGGVEADSITT